MLCPGLSVTFLSVPRSAASLALILPTPIFTTAREDALRSFFSFFGFFFSGAFAFAFAFLTGFGAFFVVFADLETFLLVLGMFAILMRRLENDGTTRRQSSAAGRREKGREQSGCSCHPAR